MIELGKNSTENMFIVSFPSPSVLLGGPLNIATNYFEGNLNYFFLSLFLSSLARNERGLKTVRGIGLIPRERFQPLSQLYSALPRKTCIEGGDRAVTKSCDRASREVLWSKVLEPRVRPKAAERGPGGWCRNVSH